VVPPDPEFDKESPWSKAHGERLSRELARLGHCSQPLPPSETAEVTLRLTYGQDGAPLSQHVVASTPNACALTDCLKQALAEVRAPKLLIERAAYDLALVLRGGAAPERSEEPPAVLAPDDAVTEGSCVDPEVARLSHAKVREVVSTRHDGLKACYSQAIYRDHAAEGNVTFEFVIGREGEVASAQARAATLHDCGAINCMLGELRALSFPAPVGRSVRVIYPIRYLLEQDPVILR
jgi:hypothetical protein